MWQHTLLRGRVSLVVGVGYSLAIFGVMWFVVLPLLDLVVLRLNGVVFAIAHMMWGGALGLALGRRESPALRAGFTHKRPTLRDQGPRDLGDPLGPACFAMGGALVRLV